LETLDFPLRAPGVQNSQLLSSKPVCQRNGALRSLKRERLLVRFAAMRAGMQTNRNAPGLLIPARSVAGNVP
jgi:hypothetical protein